MENRLLFIDASEDELNELMVGRLAGDAVNWHRDGGLQRIGRSRTGVLVVSAGHHTHLAKPIAIVTAPENHKRLFGRFSSLRSDVSPLSTWCHVFDPKCFEMVRELTRDADLGGYEASWTGLSVAEATLLAQRPADKLKVAACFATTSFAVARAHSVWPRFASTEIVEKYEAAHRLMRAGNFADNRIAVRFQSIWDGLSKAAEGEAWNDRGVARAIHVLREARIEKSQDEHLILAKALSDWPEAKMLEELSRMTPEDRVRAFDHLVEELRNSRGKSSRIDILAFVAGYVATIAAGGAPSLGLAEKVASDWPEILGWAYAIGGIGEGVTWTSSFHGLGRLVSREIMRPLHLNEPPSSDFALEEGTALIDRQLTDPFVHLQIKQARSVTISILPGVNVAVPLPDAVETSGPAANRQRWRTQTAPIADRTSLDALVDTIWPLISRRLADEGYGKKQGGKAAGKQKPSQRKLPLDD